MSRPALDDAVKLLDERDVALVGGGDTQRPDGGGCTEPYPLPPWTVPDGTLQPSQF